MTYEEPKHAVLPFLSDLTYVSATLIDNYYMEGTLGILLCIDKVLDKTHNNIHGRYIRNSIIFIDKVLDKTYNNSTENMWDQ